MSGNKRFYDQNVQVKRKEDRMYFKVTFSLALLSGKVLFLQGFFFSFNNKGGHHGVLIKEAHNSFFGIGVDLFKSISLMEGLLRFPSYFTNFLTYDQILCFSWFPSNSCYYSNDDAKHFVLDNVDYLKI